MEKKTITKRKPAKLYKHSRGLAILSALANGTLEIGAAIAEVSHSYPSISRLQWRAAHDKNIKAPKIDLQKILESRRERNNYRRAAESLRKRRYAKLVKRKGKLILIVTALGKKYLREIEIENLSIPEPNQWDKRWRIVLFDIPESLRPQRDIFRDRLRRLGFLRFQKSAFVLPFPCEDELDALIQYLGIADHVTFFTTDSLGYQEVVALHYFGLER